MYSAQICSLV
uniref:Uncharacterized protein n=1 Tax=Arundo donax TaxID=35708 RepID=A0A0A9AF03_ARUDO